MVTTLLRPLPVVVPSSGFLQGENVVQRRGPWKATQRASRECRIMAMSGSAKEPAWKEKLRLQEKHEQETKEKQRQLEEAYRQKMAASRSGSTPAAEITPLADLPFLPYVSEGKIADLTQPGVKASVYAIADKNKVVQYIGVTRGIYSSMRLHMARKPALCYYVKVQQITKPSRTQLEDIRNAWIKELGGAPPGNDNGPVQNTWENPVDVKPMMTPEEVEAMKAAAPGPELVKVLKNAARRVEAMMEADYQALGLTETMRFDPKLKEKGLLDLKNQREVDTKVPDEKPGAAKK
eukprot:jgi/Mesvir1/18711/Mv12422-RA.1